MFHEQPSNAGITTWASRAEFWKAEPYRKRTQRGRPARTRQPLILSGHGVSLRIRHGALEVRNGFTHYPQAREEWRFFPGDWRQPSRIVILDGDGSLTFDVLAWLSSQGIPLIQLDWRGRAGVVAGGQGYVAESHLVEAQRHTQADAARALTISRWLIAKKFARSSATLSGVVPYSEAREQALAELATSAGEIEVWPPQTMNELRGIEGRVAHAYFAGWREIPLRWKGVGRKPVPPDWHRLSPRVSRVTQTNRQATHPMNALLNYGYAMLESQVQMAVVAAGLDPTLGLMHAPQPGRPAFVLDLMEPLRPAVDAAVLGFVQSHTFEPADFTLSAEGICRLHPALARRLVAEIGEIGRIEQILDEVIVRSVQNL